MCELSGLPPGTPLLAYEEAKFDPHCMVLQLEPDQILGHPGLTALESGDIICFQTAPPVAADAMPAAAAAAGVTEAPAAAAANAGAGTPAAEAAAAAAAAEQDSSGTRQQQQQQQDPAGGGTRTVVDFLQAIAENTAAQQQARTEQVSARITRTGVPSGDPKTPSPFTYITPIIFAITLASPHTRSPSLDQLPLPKHGCFKACRVHLSTKQEARCSKYSMNAWCLPRGTMLTKLLLQHGISPLGRRMSSQTQFD